MSYLYLSWFIHQNPVNMLLSLRIWKKKLISVYVEYLVFVTQCKILWTRRLCYLYLSFQWFCSLATCLRILYWAIHSEMRNSFLREKCVLSGQYWFFSILSTFSALHFFNITLIPAFSYWFIDLCHAWSSSTIEEDSN